MGEQTSENFIAPFSAQDHLNTHSLDLPTQQVHRRTCPHRRDVVSLKVIDDIGNRIQTLLDGKDVFVVKGLEVMRSFPRRQQVG